MSPAERQRVANIWVDLAINYNRKLTHDSVTMLVNGVQDLPADQVVQVLMNWMGGKNARNFPLPIDVRENIAPEADDETLALASAARITTAIKKFGWCNSREAKAYIGDLGWRAVEAFGGWSYICENHGRALSPNAFQAQVRDICKANNKLGKIGMADQPIAISQGEASNAILAINQKLPNDKQLQGAIHESET